MDAVFHYYKEIVDLPIFTTLTLIINVNTHISTTLALLSAKKHTSYPILLVDCSDNEQELLYFKQLQKQIDFYLTSLPLKIHGETLDFLFRSIQAENILLLDSDAEIIDSSFLNNDLLKENDTFGIGFIHGPSPMSEGSMIGWKFLYYQERMFIPCVLLKIKKVCEALENGCSFAAKKVYNDFPLVPFVGQLCYFRFFFKFFQNHDLVFLKPFRRKYNDYFKPSMIYYDTGAEVYMYLKYKCCYNFIGIPTKYHEKYFKHYHGITRKILNTKDANSTDYKTVISELLDRLINIYDFNPTVYE
jgi:hypothetical protein